MNRTPHTLRAYSDLRRTKRDVAWIVIAIWFAATIGIMAFWFRSHWVSASSVAQLMALVTVIWAYPLYRATRALLTNQESLTLDFEAGVVRSGLRQQHERPLAALCPLEVVRRGGSAWNEFNQRSEYQTPSYHVIARGWHNYVLYRSLFRRRADRRCQSLLEACQGGHPTAPGQADV